MAFKYTFKPKDLSKKLDKYQAKSIRFVSYRSIEDLGPQLRNENIKQRYKELFIEPVPFTLNSLLFKNYQGKAKIDFFTFDDQSKGNPPSKYLYPVIGGGSNDVYETRFAQWLKANRYMRRNQYPVANLAYKEMMLTGANGRVLPTVYANTQRALRKTDAKQLKYNAQGSNIQDARVFAMKERFPKKAEKNKNKYRPGIYRVSTKGTSKSGTFIKPLFRFITPKPTVKRKNVTFYDILTQEAKKELPLIFEKNLKKYGM
tara:strand:- start:9042 stop:9818 length:777 start_codon:yes stop_codon:yes gene_type:complete